MYTRVLFTDCLANTIIKYLWGLFKFRTAVVVLFTTAAIMYMLCLYYSRDSNRFCGFLNHRDLYDCYGQGYK